GAARSAGVSLPGVPPDALNVPKVVQRRRHHLRRPVVCTDLFVVAAPRADSSRHAGWRHRGARAVAGDPGFPVPPAGPDQARPSDGDLAAERLLLARRPAAGIADLLSRPAGAAQSHRVVERSRSETARHDAGYLQPRPPDSEVAAEVRCARSNRLSVSL